MRRDIFLRLPPPAALLLLSSILELTQATVLPIQTTTVEYRVLNVVPWPPLPTSPPLAHDELFDLRRQISLNTVCGYIGGDPSLPATCSAGSHCVLDAEHNAVGCCPNDAAQCTAGVFTGCVDSNSGPQTEVNPYVFTCQGSDVCYKNVFAGGFSQFGCGTASNLATTVEATATGITSTLPLSTLSVSFTGSFATSTTSSSSSASTTSSSSSSSSSSSTSFTSSTSSSTSSSSSSSSSSTSSTSSSSTTSSSPTPSSSSSSSTSGAGAGATAAPGSAGVKSSTPSDRTGAIIGGTISGAAILIAVAAVAVFLLRRRRGNLRSGPGPRGPGGTEYISPMSGGPNFEALHSTPEGYESGLRPDAATGGTTTQITGGGPRPPVVPVPPQGFRHDDQHAYDAYGDLGAATLGATGEYGAYRGAQNMDADQVPLTRANTREIDDFSRGFHDALERIGEEGADSASSIGHGVMGGNGNGGSGGGGMSGAGTGEGSASSGRPLWQQNRRQSRNLMWM